MQGETETWCGPQRNLQLPLPPLTNPQSTSSLPQQPYALEPHTCAPILCIVGRVCTRRDGIVPFPRAPPRALPVVVAPQTYSQAIEPNILRNSRYTLTPVITPKNMQIIHHRGLVARIKEITREILSYGPHPPHRNYPYILSPLLCLLT